MKRLAPPSPICDLPFAICALSATEGSARFGAARPPSAGGLSAAGRGRGWFRLASAEPGGRARRSARAARCGRAAEVNARWEGYAIPIRGRRGSAGPAFALPRRGLSLLLLGLGLLIAAPALRAADPVLVPGITEPFLDVTLSASVPGILTARKFKEGDLIQEGQVVLELDRKLEELEVARRQLVRDQKKNDYEGTKKLFNSTRGVSKEDLEKKVVEFRVAAVEADVATEQLRRRQLLSPLTGTISEIQIEVGESCSAYQPLVRVDDTRRCYFVTNVEARQADR